MSGDFWSKVDMGSTDECWPWKLCVNEKGYGVTGSNGRTAKAHRMAYGLAVGPIDSSVCVLHACDNPRCCNPKHLFLGTRRENNADMVNKGRHRRGGSKTPVAQCGYERGESHHGAILDEKTVLAIRDDYANGDRVTRIAARYGRGVSTISKIVHRKSWVHI